MGSDIFTIKEVTIYLNLEQELSVLLRHLLATMAKLVGSVGTRSVVANCLLMQLLLLIVKRTQRWAHKLRVCEHQPSVLDDHTLNRFIMLYTEQR